MTDVYNGMYQIPSNERERLLSTSDSIIALPNGVRELKFDPDNSDEILNLKREIANILD